jgi:hypothetical protein
MIACPKCGNAEKSQKVSGIVAAGTGSGSYSGPTGGVTYSDGQWGTVGGYTTLSGQHSTTLAQLLSPPDVPKKSSTCLPVAVVGCLLYSAIPVGLGFIMSIMSPLTKQLSVVPSDTTCLLGVAIPLGGIIIATVLLLRYGQWAGQDATKHYEAAHTRWSSAMERWSRLYYCSRDDLVYDPETGESFPPGATGRYVHWSPPNAQSAT